MKESRLLPHRCKECGGQVRVVHRMVRGYRVECMKCDYKSTWQYDENKAVAFWNYDVQGKMERAYIEGALDFERLLISEYATMVSTEKGYRTMIDVDVLDQAISKLERR